jgi:hypothetical protein
MVTRESKYYRELRNYKKFIERETEELTINMFIPGLHSIIIGLILECCQGLKTLQINFLERKKIGNYVELMNKWEAIDDSFLNASKNLTILRINDTNCDYRLFIKYLLNGLKSSLKGLKISYSNPEPYRHSQYLKDDLITDLDVSKITFLHVQDFE